MKHKELTISNILGIDEWQLIQDQLAEASRLAIITVDFRGVPVTKHSKRSAFCSEIRENPITKKECYKCDAHGGIEASRTNKPYIYLCHCNIVDAAIPVIVNEKYLGAVMVGQVILEESAGVTLERIFGTLDLAGEKDSTKKIQLLQHLEELPKMRYETIRAITDVMAVFINSIVDKKIMDESMLYEEEMENTTSGTSSGGNFSMESMLRMRDKLNYAIIDKHLGGPQESNVRSKAIKYALDYLWKNKGENITLAHMAAMCHLSCSYFSRLFSSELGCSYSDYVNKIKVEWAKQWLENSTDTVSRVSDMFGFADAGYFIKVFKRYVGTTPAAFRREKK